MLPVLQVSFAMLYPAIFRTLRFFLALSYFYFSTNHSNLMFMMLFHTFIVRLPFSASPWVNSFVVLVLLLFSVSCFVLTYN